MFVKPKFVNEELTARAWERDAAPESPIMFEPKFKLVKEELTARALERDPARLFCLNLSFKFK